MMATAMITGTGAAEHRFMAAVATRSSGACWILIQRQQAEIGHVGQQVKDDHQAGARRASERGMLRLGSFTSPAVNVMLFQASEEKSEPTWATQKAINNPNPPAAA